MTTATAILKVRDGKPIPPIVNWAKVALVQIWGPHSPDKEHIKHQALTNPVNRVPVQHMDDAAKEWLDPRDE